MRAAALSSSSGESGGSPGPVQWPWTWSPSRLLSSPALRCCDPRRAGGRPGAAAGGPSAAEHLLESQFANAGYDDTAAVSCRRAIRLGSATRCQVRYANGDTQLILVGLDGRGDLDITIPYPAQRRPGG